jgi:hypothetical protein
MILLSLLTADVSVPAIPIAALNYIDKVDDELDTSGTPHPDFASGNRNRLVEAVSRVWSLPP